MSNNPSFFKSRVYVLIHISRPGEKLGDLTVQETALCLRVLRPCCAVFQSYGFTESLSWLSLSFSHQLKGDSNNLFFFPPFFFRVSVRLRWYQNLGNIVKHRHCTNVSLVHEREWSHALEKLSSGRARSQHSHQGRKTWAPSGSQAVSRGQVCLCGPLFSWIA